MYHMYETPDTESETFGFLGDVDVDTIKSQAVARKAENMAVPAPPRAGLSPLLLVGLAAGAWFLLRGRGSRKLW